MSHWPNTVCPAALMHAITATSDHPLLPDPTLSCLAPTALGCVRAQRSGNPVSKIWLMRARPSRVAARRVSPCHDPCGRLLLPTFPHVADLHSDRSQPQASVDAIGEPWPFWQVPGPNPKYLDFEKRPVSYSILDLVATPAGSLVDAGVTVDGVTRLPATHGSAVSRHTVNLISVFFLRWRGYNASGMPLVSKLLIRTYTTANPRRSRTRIFFLSKCWQRGPPLF
jgi:hypothetical protein